MAVSRALRRLLRIRELEEEQGRIALEAAVGDLNRLRNAQAATAERGRGGRRLVGTSAVTGEFTDRLAGLEETCAAERFALALAPRIADADEEVANMREDYLGRDADPGGRSAGCVGRREKKPAGARRLVPQPSAPDGAGSPAGSNRGFGSCRRRAGRGIGS